MNKLKAYILNNTSNFILLAVIYSLLCVSFPLELVYYKVFSSEIGFNIVAIIYKAVCSILPILFYFSIDFKFHCKNDNFSIIILIICFVITINNFPFFTVIEKFGYLTSNVSLWINHIFVCLTTSIFEEAIFRGVILSILISQVFKNDKYKSFKALIISSLLFSLIHIANLFSGEEWYFVLLQVSYSFLTGIIFSLGYLISGKLIVAIILHFLYNLGGSLQDNGIIFGGLWSPFQTIETTILSIIFGLVILIYIYKKFIKDIKDESSSSKG